MGRITDDQIAMALCCGEACSAGPNTGLCHKWDFNNEVKRVRDLLWREEDAVWNAAIDAVIYKLQNNLLLSNTGIDIVKRVKKA